MEEGRATSRPAFFLRVGQQRQSPDGSVWGSSRLVGGSTTTRSGLGPFAFGSFLTLAVAGIALVLSREDLAYKHEQ